MSIHAVRTAHRPTSWPHIRSSALSSPSLTGADDLACTDREPIAEIGSFLGSPGLCRLDSASCGGAPSQPRVIGVLAGLQALRAMWP